MATMSLFKEKYSQLKHSFNTKTLQWVIIAIAFIVNSLALYLYSNWTWFFGLAFIIALGYTQINFLVKPDEFSKYKASKTMLLSFCVFGLLQLISLIKVPTDDVVYMVYTTFKGFFPVLAFFGLLVKVGLHNIKRLEENALNIINFVIIYYAVLFAIGEFGTDIKEYAVAEPTQFLALLITLYLITSCYKFVMNTYFYPRTMGYETGGYALARAKPFSSEAEKDSRTQFDMRVSSAHESGHAMVFAALGMIPERMLVTTQSGVTDAGIPHGGYVTGLNTENTFATKSFQEWYMLVYLAGQFGEKYILNQQTLGAMTDTEQWLYAANLYLKNNFNGVYYGKPTNKLEMDEKNAALNALMAEQKAQLDAFFAANREPLNAIYEALYDKGTLKQADLIPLLSNVTIPEDFPKPFGDFDEFSATWDNSKGFY